MGAAEIFAFIGLVLKLALIIFEKVQKTPIEQRQKEMADFDAALEKAKTTKDLGDLSDWLGKHT
jgi:hypothetical protein